MNACHMHLSLSFVTAACQRSLPLLTQMPSRCAVHPRSRPKMSDDFDNIFSKKSIFRKIFHVEMLLRTQPTTPLQIFSHFMLNSYVIFKSSKASRRPYHNLGINRLRGGSKQKSLEIDTSTSSLPSFTDI